MITALVQFKLPQPISREKVQEIFLSTAPKYREVPGLLRKYYLLSMDGQKQPAGYWAFRFWIGTKRSWRVCGLKSLKEALPSVSTDGRRLGWFPGEATRGPVPFRSG